MKNLDPADVKLLLDGLRLVRVTIGEVARIGASLPGVSSDMRGLRAQIDELRAELETPGNQLLTPPTAPRLEPERQETGPA